MERGEFICPECGSREAKGFTMIEPSPRSSGFWASVFSTITCAECGREIPAHLAERWNGLSVEDARGKWREVYREA